MRRISRRPPRPSRKAKLMPRSGASAERDDALISLRGIDKRFGAVQALAGVDVQIGSGRMLSVCGHNGAGKSTLMQILAGTLSPSAGTLRIAGREVGPGYDVRRAHALGIRCVFQELSLCPNLRVFENARVIHKALRGPGWRRRARSLIGAALDEIFPGHGIDPDRPVESLSLGQRQMVEIARAFTVTDEPVRLVILDEPTSSLDATAAEQLMTYTAKARSRGIALTFISHRLAEVLEHADDIVVMRDGQVAGGGPAKGYTEAMLVESMGVVSADDTEEEVAARDSAAASEVRVEAPPKTPGGIGFRVRAGEVVGLAGLDGHGQRDLLLAVFAAARTQHGPPTVRGSAAYVSGDRQSEGIFPLWSVADNTTIGLIRGMARFGFVNLREEQETARQWRERLRIRTPDVEHPIMSLSGGNQQKVLVARAFAGKADIILLDDPLRGVDVGTKRELYAAVHRQAERGRSFLWYTTENAELVNCDRVYVLYQGQITDEIERAELTEERVIRSSFRQEHDVVG
jgi:ribose transport system ATP-binding protein